MIIMRTAPDNVDTGSSAQQAAQQSKRDEEACEPFDVHGVGAQGHTIVCDGPEHPDRRIPYRLAPFSASDFEVPEYEASL